VTKGTPTKSSADASATHGVALISLPALGAMQTRRRARDAVIRLVDGLVGESLETGDGVAERRVRVGRRLAELAAPIRAVEAPDVDEARKSLGRAERAFADEVIVARDTLENAVVQPVSDGSDRFWDVLTWRLANDR